MKRSKVEYLGDHVKPVKLRSGFWRSLFGSTKYICSKCRFQCINEPGWKEGDCTIYICKECAPTKRKATEILFNL